MTWALSVLIWISLFFLQLVCAVCCVVFWPVTSLGCYLLCRWAKEARAEDFLVFCFAGTACGLAFALSAFAQFPSVDGWPIVLFLVYIAGALVLMDMAQKRGIERIYIRRFNKGAKEGGT